MGTEREVVWWKVQRGRKEGATYTYMVGGGGVQSDERDRRLGEEESIIAGFPSITLWSHTAHENGSI